MEQTDPYWNQMVNRISLDDLPLDVPLNEYSRLLGYPAGVLPEGRAGDLAREALEWFEAHGDRAQYGIEMTHLKIDGDKLIFDAGRQLTCRLLAERLRNAEAHALAMVAVTAGRKIDARVARLWAEDKPDEAYMLEQLGASVAEGLIRAVGARICQRAEPRGEAVLAHYSPGYPGWDMAEQLDLYAILASALGLERLPAIAIMDSAMLEPKHSLMGVFGLTRKGATVLYSPKDCPCCSCVFLPCDYRRMPYQPSP